MHIDTHTHRQKNNPLSRYIPAKPHTLKSLSLVNSQARQNPNMQASWGNDFQALYRSVETWHYLREGFGLRWLSLGLGACRRGVSASALVG